MQYRTIGALVIIIACIVLWLIPEKCLFDNHQGNTLCIAKMMFGIDCPGCGLTRGIYCVLHFQFQKSLQYNLASPIFMLLLMGQFLSVYKPDLKITMKLNKAAYYLFIVAITVNYTYKIITHQLFT